MMLAPSDYLVIGALVPAAWFAVSYGVWSPWYRAALGVVVFMYALTVVALLGLIVYGIVVGERIGEPVRFVVALALFVSLSAKVVVLHMERRAGRIGTRPNERIDHDESQRDHAGA
jgi:hypothetical protein